MGCKLRTEAPVNGGCNYNGPKVGNSLSGQVPTRNEWDKSMAWALSQLRLMKLEVFGKDAVCPYQDGKTNEPLLQRHLTLKVFMCRIVGRL